MTEMNNSTLPEILRRRSKEQPEKVGYIFLKNGEEADEELTYGALDLAARVRKTALVSAGLSGANVVLLYPSGLEFIRTLLGCMYAGVSGAPVQVPRSRQGIQRLRRIADDACTSIILTTASVKGELEENFATLPELEGLTFIDTESFPPDTSGDWEMSPPDPNDIALLQYTSGSTGDPKGVIVTHANFLANAAETDELWPCEPRGTVVNWLPLFHDMGLLFGVILPLWAGIPSYLMAPETFIRKPSRWLEAISKLGGTHAAAPNFAYELCIRSIENGRATSELDLSTWRVAANGAEPVRWQTMRAFTEKFASVGFDPRAMCPGYGLAENTLKATGSPQDQKPSVRWISATALRNHRVEFVTTMTAGAVPVVSSGMTVPGTQVRIVDPVTSMACLPNQVGEIWVSGPCVAAGYYGRPAETQTTFRAQILAEQGAQEFFLRTGDLGFLHRDELYVTGRLKDVIIRNGRNYYPQDIELSAEAAVLGLHPNCAAAFSVDDGRTERLVVVVEVDGRVLKAVGPSDLRRFVHQAVWENQRLEADYVMVVRRGSLPRTSSGKVQRRACRQRYEKGEFVQLVGIEQET